MSKPKLVVLGFLSRAPMYGYQIGHVVEEFGLPVWAGIKLPTIYKALQDLEASQHIRGEQVTEGNNPPRTVFHLIDKGRKLHSELVQHYLSSVTTSSQDWWLTLSFARHAISKEQLESAVRMRLDRLKHTKDSVRNSTCAHMLETGDLPFVQRHVLQLGLRHHKEETKTLKELLADVLTGGHNDFYLKEGERA